MSYVDLTDPGLPELHTQVAVRAANEGIPIASIARIVNQPFDLVHDVLRSALALGQITYMPKGDWPPGTKWSERRPTILRAASAEEVAFAVRKHFRLTPLEAGVMMVLLRFECADKDKLHGVVEALRFSRATRPDSPEETDPKIVDVIICKLRKKLKSADPAFVLTTSWGMGYYFDHKVKEAIYAAIGGVTPPPLVRPDAGAVGLEDLGERDGTSYH